MALLSRAPSQRWPGFLLTAPQRPNGDPPSLFRVSCRVPRGGQVSDLRACHHLLPSWAPHANSAAGQNSRDYVLLGAYASSHSCSSRSRNDRTAVPWFGVRSSCVMMFAHCLAQQWIGQKKMNISQLDPHLTSRRDQTHRSSRA